MRNPLNHYRRFPFPVNISVPRFPSEGTTVATSRYPSDVRFILFLPLLSFLSFFFCWREYDRENATASRSPLDPTRSSDHGELNWTPNASYSSMFLVVTERSRTVTSPIGALNRATLFSTISRDFNKPPLFPLPLFPKRAILSGNPCGLPSNFLELVANRQDGLFFLQLWISNYPDRSFKTKPKIK